MKLFHHTTFSKCVNAFPCSLPKPIITMTQKVSCNTIAMGLRGSFQNMYENTSLNCVKCGLAVDYQAHFMECPSYEDLREGLDMDKDLDLVTFFRKVMDRRNEE